MHEVLADSLGMKLVNYDSVKPVEVPCELGDDQFPQDKEQCVVKILDLMTEDFEEAAQSYQEQLQQVASHIQQAHSDAALLEQIKLNVTA